MFGPWHPSFLNACCFPQILTAQVLTRLKFSWLGDPALSNDKVWKSTFKIALVILVAYMILYAIFGGPPPIVMEVADDDLHEVTYYDESNWCPSTWHQRALTSVVSTVLLWRVHSYRHDQGPRCRACPTWYPQ
jgi:hypothetical protein